MTRLYALRNTVCLARVDLFARLLDLFQYGRVVDIFFGLDVRGLGVEGNVEGFDTCITLSECTQLAGALKRGGRLYRQASSAPSPLRRSSRRRSW